MFSRCARFSTTTSTTVSDGSLGKGRFIMPRDVLRENVNLLLADVRRLGRSSLDPAEFWLSRKRCWQVARQRAVAGANRTRNVQPASEKPSVVGTKRSIWFTPTGQKQGTFDSLRCRKNLTPMRLRLEPRIMDVLDCVGLASTCRRVPVTKTGTPDQRRRAPPWRRSRAPSVPQG